MFPSITYFCDGVLRTAKKAKNSYQPFIYLPFAVLILSACAITPEPSDEADLLDRVELNLANMYADQEPLTGPIDLYQAVARGLKYNLDKRLKLLERGLEEARLSKTHAAGCCQGRLPGAQQLRRIKQSQSRHRHSEFWRLDVFRQEIAHLGFANDLERA